MIQVDKAGKPVAIWDLKTGGAKLTQARINQIRNQLPDKFKKIPIYELRLPSRGYSSPGPK